MTSVIVLFDTRLHAPGHSGDVTPKNPGDALLRVDATTPLATAVHDVENAARRLGKPCDLFIMCHGKATASGLPGVTQPVGGSGLVLCQDQLDVTNLHMLAPWRGLIDNIWLYVCAAAYDERQPMRYIPGATTQSGGHDFCGRMAQESGAWVYASDANQVFEDAPRKAADIVLKLIGKPYDGEIDFGGWEGNLRRFDPATGAANLLPP